MSKLKLLILDAGIVIHLHECGIWQNLITVSEIHLARTVAEDEAVYCEIGGEKSYIDLSVNISQSRVKVFDVALSEIKKFQDQFDPRYSGDLDPGETESLAFLHQSKEEFLISSGDAIVYRVLGRLGLGERGISLEEILTKIGLSRSGLPWSCTKKFREKYTQHGGIDAVQGIGMKQSKS